MRELGRVAATCLALAACHGRVEMSDTERLQIIQTVHAAVDARFEAMNQHDAEAVGAFYQDGDGFLYAGVSDVIVGADNFRVLSAPWFSLHRDQTFDYGIVHTQVLSPTVATVTIRGSTASAAHLLWTDVMVLEGGRWVVALEHESWPGAPPPSTHPTTSS